MGSEYVAIWAKCLQENSDNFFTILKGNKNLQVIIGCLIIILLSIVAIEINSLFFNIKWLITALFVLLIASVIVSIVFLLKLREKDPAKQLQNIRTRTSILIEAFLVETRLESRNLPKVLESVQRYRDDRKNARNTFMERTFSLCICGFLVSGISLFLESYKGSESIQMTLSLLICALSISMMTIASTIWEMADTARISSLSKTDSLIRAIECEQINTQKNIDTNILNQTHHAQ